MTRTRDEVNAKSFEVEHGIGRCGNLEFAGVATASVNLTNMQRSAETAANAIAQPRRRFHETRPFLQPHFTKHPASADGIDIKHPRSVQLLAGVRRDLDVVGHAYCLFGASAHTLAALNARPVR
jgi:hypothetical protein